MLAEYMKWLRWVGVFMIFMAYPVLLIVLGSVNSSLVPGVLFGTALYFVISRHRKTHSTEE